MKFISSILITILSVLSFLFNSNDRSEETKIAHSIVKNIGIKFKKKYNVRAGSLKEAGDIGVYRLLGMSFYIDKTLTKDEGRKLLYDLIYDFLDEINQDKEFKKYMSNYPFTEKNIEISLFAMGEDGRGSFYPNIIIFDLLDGRIIYKTKLKDKLGFYSIEEETYEEAKKIVESQSTNN